MMAGPQPAFTRQTVQRSEQKAQCKSVESTRWRFPGADLDARDVAAVQVCLLGQHLLRPSLSPRRLRTLRPNLATADSSFRRRRHPGACRDSSVDQNRTVRDRVLGRASCDRLCHLRTPDQPMQKPLMRREWNVARLSLAGAPVAVLSICALLAEYPKRERVRSRRQV